MGFFIPPTQYLAKLFILWQLTLAINPTVRATQSRQATVAESFLDLRGGVDKCLSYAAINKQCNCSPRPFQRASARTASLQTFHHLMMKAVEALAFESFSNPEGCLLSNAESSTCTSLPLNY